MTIIEQIQTLLTNLGTNANEIYDTLRRQGIKGQINSTSSCPVARYLKNNTDGTQSLFVQYRYVYLYSEAMHIQLSDAVLSFIDHFDEGKYPDMIEQERKEITCCDQ